MYGIAHISNFCSRAQQFSHLNNEKDVHNIYIDILILYPICN